MKKNISILWFVVGLVMWIGILEFVLSFPFGRILNTNDVVSSPYLKGLVHIGISILSILITTFMANKRYIIPSSLLKIVIYVTLVNITFQTVNQLMLILVLGPHLPFSSYLLINIFPVLLLPIVTGVVIYIFLSLFLKQNNSEQAKPILG